MNGVDKCDQFLASYSFCHETVKCLKKVFVRMFELSWQLSIVWWFFLKYWVWRKYQSHKLYRVELTHQLVQRLLDCKASSENSYYCAGRWPAKMNEVHLVGKHCCVLCGYKKKDRKYARKKTNYCARCDKFVCKDCFELYHTKSNPVWKHLEYFWYSFLFIFITWHIYNIVFSKRAVDN